MLRIGPHWLIPAESLRYKAVHSGGPGGQNVNKVATKVELRLDLSACGDPPDDVVLRLRQQQGGRINSDDELIVTSDRYRSQSRNRDDAENKLIEMLQAAWFKPIERRPTRPGRGARERRLKEKRETSQRKQHRRKPEHGDE